MNPSIVPTDPLSHLVALVVAEIGRKASLAGIQCLGVGEETSEEDKKKAAAQFKGLFITVSCLTGKNDKPGVPGPRVALDLVVSAWELPKINRSSKGMRVPASQCALDIAAALDLYQPPGFGLLSFIDFGPVEDEDFLVFADRFRTTINLQTQAELRGAPQ
jgi:hypothetical protein